MSYQVRGTNARNVCQPFQGFPTGSGRRKKKLHTPPPVERHMIPVHIVSYIVPPSRRFEPKTFVVVGSGRLCVRGLVNNERMRYTAVYLQ